MHTSYKKNFTPRSEKDLEKSFHTRPGQKLGGPCRIKNTGGCHLQQGAVSSPKLTWGEWSASSSPSLSVESSSLILVIRGVYLSPLSTLAIYIRCQLGTYVAIQKFKNSDFDIHPCGWDTCFYLMGSSSLLWTLAWIFLAHDNPKLHPNITAEVRMSHEILAEWLHSLRQTTSFKTRIWWLTHMSSTIPNRWDGLQELAEIEEIPVKEKAPPLPWRAVVTSPPIWGIIFTDAANTFGL